MTIPSYPKVYNIGHPMVAELFSDDVLIEEKIDGSQFSFCRHGENLTCRSRGQEIIPDAPETMFAVAVKAVQEIQDQLQEGWVYRGEYLQKPKHNALAYQRVPGRNIILFDINVGMETYLPRQEKETEAERLQIEVVPVLAAGLFTNPDDLLKLLDRESCLGGVKVEGIVVKNYARFGKDGKALMGKFVSEAFKEKHSAEWRKANPTVGDIIEQLIASLRNERRWEKAVERLRDAGTLLREPKDIGPLIKSVQQDIQDEEMEYIQAQLSKYALPRIVRASTAGLPEWYKEKLLRESFTHD